MNESMGKKHICILQYILSISFVNHLLTKMRIHQELVIFLIEHQQTMYVCVYIYIWDIISDMYFMYLPKPEQLPNPDFHVHQTWS